jgi:hypothetical protein
VRDPHLAPLCGAVVARGSALASGGGARRANTLRRFASSLHGVVCVCVCVRLCACARLCVCAYVLTEAAFVTGSASGQARAL